MFFLLANVISDTIVVYAAAEAKAEYAELDEG